MTTTSNALTNTSDNTATIPSITSSTTSTAFPTNTWGYSTASGSSDTITYNPIPTGTTTLKDTSAASTDIIPFTIATKVDLTNPAGTYTNTFSFSAVAKLLSYTITWNSMGGSAVSPTTVIEGSPIGTLPAPTKDGFNFLGWFTAADGGTEVTTATTVNSNVTYYARWEKLKTLSEITNMQEMTSAICAASAENETKQLKDTRDDKLYWVSKLADGNCWMTQNLDLDLNANTLPLKSASSDVSADWSPAVNTSTSVFNSSDSTAQNSYDGGNYYWNGQWDGDWGSGSGYGSFSKFSTTKPASQGDHYHVGNLYQWNAATAGTGGADIKSKEAASSICPKGWRLPLSNSTDNYSFSKLLSAYSATSDTSKIIASPLFFVPAGLVDSGSLYFAGDYGGYWSSMAASSASNVYDFYFDSNGYVNPSYTDVRHDGFSIRCVAR